jgi:hypothetical protein
LCKYTQNILNVDVIKDVQVIKDNPPQSIRRGLVFGTGFSLLLISIITAKNMWEYFMDNTSSLNEFLLLIFSSWGISYVIFLWISFFVIVIRNLPGCAWTAIRLGLLKSGDVHICVDSVLNARQDITHSESGISVELRKTDGFKLWTVGLVALLVFAYILTIDSVDFNTLPVRLIAIGVISSLYYLYDLTIHEFSKGKDGKGRELEGKGDYPRVLSEYLGGLRKRC